MNRIDTLFQQKKSHILSVYFTAGHPTLNSTQEILTALEESGTDMVEIGMPFSDPLADGPVIQDSSTRALKNGMGLHELFSQLTDVRQKVTMPLLLMGYINPVLQFGVEAFCKKCREVGVDGVILPDLPMDVYKSSFQKFFEENDLRFIFLITPQTSDQRIEMIDSVSKGFIYMVSSASTTGAKGIIETSQVNYFERVKALKLKNPLIIGFGISNRETFQRACSYASGAIIGSAFVKMLNETTDVKKGITHFVHSILGNS